MASATARARQPDKRKGRTATVQPLQNFHSISNRTDTASALRLQRLAALGVGGSSAILLSSLIWGTDGGNALIGGVA